MTQFHIADDHPLFRDALLGIIQRHYPDSEVSQSSDLESTLAALSQQPDLDVLLLDLHMPGSQDLFGLVAVREKFPSVPVIVVSAREDLETISRAIGHGASAYIPKSATPAMIQEAIDKVSEGERWVQIGRAHV